ncbi:regulator of (H+)-ATPase in vacuolar membrane [Sorochytrium milnesiophthora]
MIKGTSRVTAKSPLRTLTGILAEFYDYIFDSDLLELWEALKSWTFDGRVIDNMLLRKDSALLQQAQEAKSSDADEATPAQPATHEYRKEIVVQSEVPVWALGIDRSNPRYAAFSFPKVVVEIDIEKSWKFSKAQLKNKRDKSGSPPGVAATPPIDVPSTSLDEKASTLARSAPMSHDLAVPIPPSPPSTLRRQTETIIATLKRKDTTSSKRTELQRVQSTDDLQTLRRRTLSTGNRPEPDPNAPGVDPSYSLRRPGGSTWIESHPSLPYYISCMTDSQGRTLLNAYEFGQPEILGSIAHGSGKASRVRFDRYGERFGVVDDAGVLSLYRFEPTAYNGRTPFFLLPCHSRYASDLAFLDSDSVVASAGSSPGHINNIAIWDTLLPAHKALVKGFHIHESGASALAYDRQRHMLYSAGKKGDMAVIDIRQHAIVKTFQAHSHLIQTLAMDEHHGVVMSGSSDGNIKLWDLQTFADVGHLKQVHAAKRFITPSLEKAPVTMYGITEISCSEYYAMTCGADGNVHLLKHEP